MSKPKPQLPTKPTNIRQSLANNPKGNLVIHSTIKIQSQQQPCSQHPPSIYEMQGQPTVHLIQDKKYQKQTNPNQTLPLQTTPLPPDLPQQPTRTQNRQPTQPNPLKTSQTSQAQHIIIRRFQPGPLQNTIQIHFQLQKNSNRKHQSIFIFLSVNIFLLAVSIFNADMLLDMTDKQNTNRKVVILCSAIGVGGIVAVMADVCLVGWKNVLRLYFYLDTVVPAQISVFISFYYLMKIYQPWQYAQIVLVVFFPFFIIFMPGNLRVNVKHANWSRWRVLTYKATMVVSGVVAFYIGFIYLRGGYKISQGYLPEIQAKIKNLMVLFVFALNQFIFQLFKRVSDFDQTNQMVSEYRLKSMDQEEEELASVLASEEGTRNLIEMGMG